MKLPGIFIVLFFISAIFMISEEVKIDWNTFAGSSGVDSGTSVCIGNPATGGHLFTTGYSTRSWDTAKYGNPLLTKEGIDYEDVIYVASYTTKGALRWYTFLGNGDFDQGHSIDIDSSGSLVVAGQATDPWPSAKYGIPVQAYNPSAIDIFVAGMNTEGDLIWHTFLGGSDFDFAYSVKISDTAGAIYVTGESYGPWDTSKYGNPVKDFSGDHDIFVASLNLNGELQWYTFLGGSGGDTGRDILYAENNIYITGYSESGWDTDKFGKAGTGHNGGKDIILAKLNENGELQRYHYYGGPGDDFGNGISAPSVGINPCFYVTGGSEGEWDEDMYAEPRVLYNGGQDIFIFECSTDKLSMNWYTFHGSDWREEGTGIQLSRSGDMYVSGITRTTGWNYSYWDPVKYGTSYFYGIMNLNPKAVILRANTHGITQWNAQVGHQSSNDLGTGLAIDVNDRVFLIGEALSDDWGYQNVFPDPILTHNDSGDQMLISFIEEFTVNAIVNEGSGSASPQTQQIEINGSGSVKFKSPKGYELASITDNGVPMPLSNPYQFSNVREDHDIEVSFSVQSYNILCSVTSGNGSVKARDTKVEFDETAYVDIHPAPGFEINSLIDNGIEMPVNNPYVILDVRTDHQIEVTFIRKSYPPTLSLTGTRKSENAWILKKEYAELNIEITEHPTDPIEISEFILYKIVNGAKTELSSWISAGTYTFTDTSIKSGEPASYELIAVIHTGEIAATSGIITL